MAAPLLQKERVLELLRQAEVEHEVFEHAEVATADAQVSGWCGPQKRSIDRYLLLCSPPSAHLAPIGATRAAPPIQTTPLAQVQALAHVQGVVVTKNLFLRVRPGR